MTTRSKAKQPPVEKLTGENALSLQRAEDQMQQMIKRVSVLEDTLTTAVSDTRTAIKDIMLEHQHMRERYAKMLSGLKQQREEHYQLQLQHVATSSQVTSLERHMDRFIEVLRTAKPSLYESESQNAAVKERSQHVDVDACSEASFTSFTAESRASELSDARSETAGALDRHARSTSEVASRALEMHRGRQGA